MVIRSTVILTHCLHQSDGIDREECKELVNLKIFSGTSADGIIYYRGVENKSLQIF